MNDLTEPSIGVVEEAPEATHEELEASEKPADNIVGVQDQTMSQESPPGAEPVLTAGGSLKRSWRDLKWVDGDKSKGLDRNAMPWLPRLTSRDEVDYKEMEERVRDTLIDLHGADLRYAKLEKSNLICADLANANLYHANLMNANLRNAKLDNADLSCANLQGANLTKANLMNVTLTKANLSGVNFERAVVSGAIMDGVTFGHASVPRKRCPPPILSVDNTLRQLVYGMALEALGGNGDGNQTFGDDLDEVEDPKGEMDEMEIYVIPMPTSWDDLTNQRGELKDYAMEHRNRIIDHIESAGNFIHNAFLNDIKTGLDGLKDIVCQQVNFEKSQRLKKNSALARRRWRYASVRAIAPGGLADVAEAKMKHVAMKNAEDRERQIAKVHEEHRAIMKVRGAYEKAVRMINKIEEDAERVVDEMRLGGFFEKIKTELLVKHLKREMGYELKQPEPGIVNWYHNMGVFWANLMLVVRMPPQTMAKQLSELDFFLDRLAKVEEPIEVDSWQDSVESWLALRDMLPSIQVGRAQLVLEAIFADKHVLQSLAWGEAMRDISGKPPDELLIRLKQGLSGHIKMNYFRYHKELQQEIANIKRILELKHVFFSVMTSVLLAVLISMGNFMAFILSRVVLTHILTGWSLQE